MKPELVPDWRRSWRWASQQANVAAQALLAGWIFLRDQPLPKWAMVLIWAVLIWGFVGRLLRKKPEENDECTLD